MEYFNTHIKFRKMELFKLGRSKEKENSYSELITLLRNYKQANGEVLDREKFNLYDTLTLSQYKEINLDNPFRKTKGSTEEKSESSITWSEKDRLAKSLANFEPNSSEVLLKHDFNAMNSICEEKSEDVDEGGRISRRESSQVSISSSSQSLAYEDIMQGLDSATNVGRFKTATLSVFTLSMFN